MPSPTSATESTRPRLLDLFCGAGGAAVGYHRAGFDVVGVDLVVQYDYPFRFHLGDAMTFPLDGFDAIHASPPCKHRTVARHGGRRQDAMFDPHPDLLTPMLRRLRLLSVPWVVENVPGPQLDAPHVITLCGSMFRLLIRRHRLFASNVPLLQPECRHAAQGPVVGVYGTGGGDSGRAARGGGGGVKVSGADAARALGIDWTERQTGLSQAIPPVYTEFVGAHLMAAVTAATRLP